MCPSRTVEAAFMACDPSRARYEQEPGHGRANPRPRKKALEDIHLRTARRNGGDCGVAILRPHRHPTTRARDSLSLGAHSRFGCDTPKRLSRFPRPQMDSRTLRRAKVQVWESVAGMSARRSAGSAQIAWSTRNDTICSGA
jgi:hypothetical protein